MIPTFPALCVPTLGTLYISYGSASTIDGTLERKDVMARHRPASPATSYHRSSSAIAHVQRPEKEGFSTQRLASRRRGFSRDIARSGSRLNIKKKVRRPENLKHHVLLVDSKNPGSLRSRREVMYLNRRYGFRLGYPAGG